MPLRACFKITIAPLVLEKGLKIEDEDEDEDDYDSGKGIFKTGSEPLNAWIMPDQNSRHLSTGLRSN